MTLKDFLFKNTSPRQIALKNTFWLSASSIIGKLIRAVVVIYAARVLGTESYGIFSYGLSIASIFYLFADIGLSSLFIRDYISRPNDRKPYLATIATIKAILILLSLGVTAWIAPQVATLPEAKTLLWLFAILLAFDGLRNFGVSIFRARNRMDIEARIEITAEICGALAAAAVLLTVPSVKNLLITYVFSSAFGLALVIFAVPKRSLQMIFSFTRWNLVWPVLSAALPYALVGIFAMLMTNIDMLFIGVYLDANAAGLYAAALRPISLLYLLPGFVSFGIFPLINTFITSGDTQKLRRLIETAMTATLAVALPIAIGGIILAPGLVTTVFGIDYAGSANAFRILLLTLIPIFPGFILSNTLFAYQKRMAPIIATSIGATINVALDIFLIPRYAIAGSAIATICAQLFMNLYLYREVKKIIPIALIRKTHILWISSILMAAVILALDAMRLHVFMLIPIGALAYYISLKLLREPLLNEFRELRK